MERDKAWVEQQRRRLLTWDRDTLIEWLQWVDPNGVWTDEDMAAEHMEPMTVEDAVDQVMMFVAMNQETPEEMMKLSDRPVTGEYGEPKGARPKYNAISDDANKPTVGHAAMKPNDRPAVTKF